MSERYGDRDRRERWIAGAGVVLVHGAIGWLLVAGLAPSLVRQASESLQIFDLPQPPRPPPPERSMPKPAADPRKSGAAAPANLDARPTEIVAPILPPPLPPPVIAAPVAGPDVAARAGAAPVPGPGTGGGGAGVGTGSGGYGDGQGAGGRGTFARKIAGQIRDGDYPKAAARAGIGGTVWVRYTVTVKGRAEDCRVTRSSGNAELDAVTCKLVTKRFRYRPGTDAAGRFVSSVVEEDHVWVIDDPDEDY
ncbi:energy transducer TonB [Sphingomonas sp. PB4P5]|uniref:energy transducer TonB n=1 Tax=Parasphingomonas puruogangriensis TaxID=3096155 RepID=UPI002FCB3C41